MKSAGGDVLRLLIIGYGNPLRGDDGAGWHVAECLEKQVAYRDVEILIRHQLFPEMAETISRAGQVIFVDAAEGIAAGEVQEAAVEPAGTIDRPMTHHLTPETLLAYARDLYGRFPPATLYRIGAASFAHEEQLTPAVREACDRLIARLMQQIASGAT